MKQADSIHDQEAAQKTGDKVPWPESNSDIKHHLVYHHGFRNQDPLLARESVIDFAALHEKAHEDKTIGLLIEHYH